MSRIGKKPIQIPDGVTVAADDQKIMVKGPKGELSWMLPREIAITIADSVLMLKAAAETKKTPALWGLSRAHIQNMVDGVTKGFEKKLEIEGIGYRVTSEGSSVLQFLLGFSHPIRFEAPAGIQLKADKNIITVFGIDKALVGEIAARIRSLRPPEPYKGKGIRYQGEVIRRKAGKKAVATAS